MIDPLELIRWLKKRRPRHGVAMDEGGLELLEIAPSGRPTGACIEIGGVPDEEEHSEPAAPLAELTTKVWQVTGERPLADGNPSAITSTVFGVNEDAAWRHFDRMQNRPDFFDRPDAPRWQRHELKFKIVTQ